MNMKLTKKELTKRLRIAVKDYGKNWVDPHSSEGYSDCRYVYDDDNGKERYCIAGHVAKQLGFELQPDHEGLPASELFEELGVNMTPRAANMADNVQTLQDSGLPWGKAVKQAAK